MDERILPMIPKFENEADEARWWFEHRDELGKDLVSAMDRRGVGESSASRRVRLAEALQSKRTAA